MRMLPGDSAQLAATLAQLRSERQLWTPYGLRSLSASSSLYNQSNTQHDAPYWRAPVWLNLNYLALAALKHYAQACPILPKSWFTSCPPRLEHALLAIG